MPFLGGDRNKKNVAALILARVKPGGKTEDVGESGDGALDSLSEGEKAAGEELISAFERKDVAGLVNAFKSLWQILVSTEPEHEDEAQEKSGFMG